MINTLKENNQDLDIPLYNYNFIIDPLEIKKKGKPDYRLFYNDSIIKKVEKIYEYEMKYFWISYPWERDYILISNTCIGWTLTRKFMGLYNNPFIGSLFPNDDDYLKLCKNLYHYLNFPLKVININDVDPTKECHSMKELQKKTM